MKRFLFGLLGLLLASPALSQTTVNPTRFDTLANVVGRAPVATIANPSDQLYLRQGAVSKQLPVSTLFTNVTSLSLLGPGPQSQIFAPLSVVSGSSCAPISGQAQCNAMLVAGNLSGTYTASQIFWVDFAINNDNVVMGVGNNLSVLAVNDFLNGSSLTGNRSAILAQVNQTVASGVGNNTNYRAYVAVTGSTSTTTGDGCSVATYCGYYFGANFLVKNSANAGNVAEIVGMELDLYGTGTSTQNYKLGLALADGSPTTVPAGGFDAALAIYTLTVGGGFGPGRGWQCAVCVAEVARSAQSALSASGTILGVHLESLTTMSAGFGIDWSSMRFVTAFLKGQAILIDATGSNMVLGANITLFNVANISSLSITGPSGSATSLYTGATEGLRAEVVSSTALILANATYPLQFGNISGTVYGQFTTAGAFLVQQANVAAITADAGTIVEQNSTTTALSIYSQSNTNFFYDGTRSTIVIPSGSTVQNASGFGSYVISNTALSGGANVLGAGVNFWGLIVGNVDNSGVWGVNIYAADSINNGNIATTGRRIVLAEFDAGVFTNNAGTTVEGVNVILIGHHGNIAAGNAFHVSTRSLGVGLSPQAQWGNGFVLDDGSVQSGGSGIIIGAQLGCYPPTACPTNVNSQKILFNRFDSGGAEHAETLYDNPQGLLTWTGTVIQVVPAAGASEVWLIAQAGQQANILFYDGATLRWQDGKNTDNTWFLFDNLQNSRTMYFTNNGGAVFDPTTTYQFQTGGASPVNIADFGITVANLWAFQKTVVHNFQTGTMPAVVNAGIAIQVVGPNANVAGIETDSYGGNASLFVSRFSHGNLGAESVPQANEVMTSINVRGAIAVGTYSAGQATINVFAPTTWVNAGNYQTAIRFSTTPNGSTTVGVAMTIFSGVVIGTGGTDPGVGNISLSGVTMSVGTPPTGNTGTCSTGVTVTGGPAAGNWISTAICNIAGTIILSGLPTAPTGYVCDAQDLTTAAVVLQETSSTTTSVTFTVRTTATVANDNIRFKCTAY